MLIPPKCFTCGRVIGNQYAFYLEESAKRKKELADRNELNTKGSTDVLLSSDNIKDVKQSVEADVLDDMGIVDSCCRRHFLSHIDIVM